MATQCERWVMDWKGLYKSRHPKGQQTEGQTSASPSPGKHTGGLVRCADTARMGKNAKLAGPGHSLPALGECDHETAAEPCLHELRTGRGDAQLFHTSCAPKSAFACAPEDVQGNG